MKRFILALFTLMCVGYVPVLGQNATPVENQQSVKKPLNQAQVFALLAGGVQSHRVAILVQERGIDFEPTADYLQMVRQTGGEDELVSALKSAKVAPSKITTTDQTGPSLEATFDFMGRMVAPEKRIILLGGLEGLDTQAGACPAFMISNRAVDLVAPTGTTQVHGYSEQTWSTFYEAENFPRYTRFDLGGIDPSSIRSVKGCCDGDALREFMKQHPNCDRTHECVMLESQFIQSGLHDLTTVLFKTADLKPTIEFGGIETPPTCQDAEKHGTECALKPVPDKTGSGILVFFRDKERAERFVTACTHAVKLCGRTPSMFPPTEPKK